MKMLQIVLMIAVASHGSAFEIISKEAAIPLVSVPYTISSPGIYYLANNIFSKSNANITITASNVVLDLGGHTLQVSAAEECILVDGSFTGPKTLVGAPGSFNVTIENGALINNFAACIQMAGCHGCVIDHVNALSNGACAIVDQNGASNRISNCNFAGGTSLQPPVLQHGESFYTVFLFACGDLFENNIVSSIGGFGVASGVSGGEFSSLGNILRNNVIWSTNPKNALKTDQFDISTGNLIPPGLPAQ